MFVSYRSKGGVSGTMSVRTEDLQIGFNRVAQKLIADGLFGEDYGRSVRYEGKVKIGTKSYPAISQAGLMVVEGGPAIPDQVELKT